MPTAHDDLLQAIDRGDNAAIAGFLDADPSLANATYKAGEWTLPILYRACMSGHVPAVRLLLERGANTQDGESIYHSAQDNRRECLELLLQHGADLSECQAPFGNTPLYFIVGHHGDEEGRAAWFQGMTWLLEHGADPNVASDKSREAPLHRAATSPRHMATARALVAHGADVNLRRADGMTPYQIAARHGNAQMAALLAEHGADTGALTPFDSVVFAALTGDTDRARALAAKHPDLFTSMSREDHAAITAAVMHGRADAVRLMVDLGFRLDAEVPYGGTPLHWAAWHGHVTMVELLVSLGAPINMRDCQHGASPLGWAAHGSCFHPHANEADYCAIVDTLVDAGATREGTINKSGEKLEGSPRVKARLNERLG
jgi:ankyrin repeat protein